jgi:tRNA threonylcarbamoyladenosine biosynthesis protein TsaB
MLLAIDTSTRSVGVALYDGVQVLSEMVWFSNNYHTVELAPVVSQVLDRAGQDASDLDGIAVAIGPGSFTGLRVGLAVAKGMCLATHVPLVGIPSLDILAAAQPVNAQRMVATLRAGRGRLAIGWYKAVDGEWQPTAKGPEIMSPRALSQKLTEPTLVCGELTGEERRMLGRKWVNVILASPAQCLRRPSYLAELGWRLMQAGKVDDPVTLAPIYLQ